MKYLSIADYNEILSDKDIIIDEFQEYVQRCAASAACTTDEQDCYLLDCVLVLLSGGERCEVFPF